MHILSGLIIDFFFILVYTVKGLFQKGTEKYDIYDFEHKKMKY